MKRGAWKKIIIENCRSAGTYRPFFDPVIDTLSTILERRDDAEKMFKKEGKQIIVEHTNKSGATNDEQNPILRLINDYNRDALQYWRDLGLTPAGLRKINEEALQKPKKGNALQEALSTLGG